jgi:DNA-binding response OmpR family regulator
MARLLLLSSATESPLPAMSLLSHAVVLAPFTPQSVATHSETDIVILDGVNDLVAAKAMAVLLRNARIPLPVVLALPETSLPVIDGGWGVTDFLTPSMSLMEIDARIRLALSRREFQSSTAVSHSGVRIDEASFQAHAGSRALDLTFKEFELLRFLVANPGRVFSREQLLAEVWGYDYFGGTRTVDVHVRRLRAKLGDHESVVGTVRNVGYRFAPSGEGDE